MKKIFTILLALSVLSFVIGGCGGGDKPTDDKAAPAKDAPADTPK
jgi:hypothetical protein